MEFSLSPAVNPQYPLSLRLDEQVDLYRFGYQYGFTHAGVGHHWISYPNVFPEPWPHMGYLAGKLPGMTIGGFIAAPLYHPVDLAEKVATLDILTKGKFVFQPGIGWRADEFIAAGTNIKYRASRFEESIELCKRLWTGQEVTFEGKHFVVQKARMAYTPIQRPHPPIWVGAQSEGAARRAARHGDAPWIPLQVGFKDVKALMDAYRDELKKVGKPFPEVIPTIRFISVDTDRQKARDRVQLEHAFDWYESSPYFTKVKVKYTHEEDLAGRAIAGTPEEVAEGLQRYVDEFGFNFFNLAIVWPSAEKEEVKRHIALLGERVLPRLKEKAK